MGVLNTPSYAKSDTLRLAVDRLLPALIALLGLFHALIYALGTPPWGLFDEHQHFHYVQMIAEQQRAPVMWRDYISEEIVDSISVTDRFETLGMGDLSTTREDIGRPGRWDLESYEGHHPPVYYAVLALFYPIGPHDVLSKLFILRVIGALVASATLLLVWASSRWLWPGTRWIAIVATLFVALNPERAAAAGRLGNDLMLEVTCAGAFSALAFAWAKGATWRRAVLVGLCLGLAILTKLSAWVIVPVALFGWVAASRLWKQSSRTTFLQWALIVVVVAVCLGPLVARNVSLYGEPTGVGAFIAHVGPLAKGSLSELLVTGAVDLVRNSWAIPWNGMQVAVKPSAALMQLVLATITAGIAYTLVSAVVRSCSAPEGRQSFTTSATSRVQGRRSDEASLSPLSLAVIVTACLALLLTSVSTLLTYVQGLVPSVQGRFLLPAMVPSAWLMGYGLWLMGRRWRGLVAGLALLMATMLGMSVLFFHSLPKYYAPRSGGFLGYWEQTRYLLFDPAGMFWDKPDFVNVWVFGAVVCGFMICGAALGALLWRVYGSPLQAWHWHALRQWIRSRRMPPADPGRLGNDVRSGSLSPHRGSARDRHVTVPDGRHLGWLADPLLWTICGLLVFYLAWVAFYPAEVFWSLDEGGKYLHLQSIVQSGDPATPMPYPGQYLDSQFRYVPLYFWSRAGDQIYSWWPVGFQLMSVPFYMLFGWRGVYLLPAIGGVVTCWLAGLLVRFTYPHPPWLAASAAVIVGLATPVAFYSTTFWEHTVSVALVMGGIVAVLHAWRTGRVGWLLAAGPLFALATYLRTDMAGIVAGLCLVLLVLHWRWSVLIGLSCGLAGVPLLFSNWLLMGHIVSRQLAAGGTVQWSPLFDGLRDAGIWFVPYVLFNSPRVGAFAIGPGMLALATLLTGLALLYPWTSCRRWVPVAASAGLVLISGYVLLQSEGYRSVHGFVLIAPCVVFSAWLYRSKALRRESPLPRILLGICVVYGAIYVARAWIPAGGLQWGPRYQLAFYPLFVAASLIGLGTEWRSLGTWTKRVVVVAYLSGLVVGLGFQVRGLLSARETREYYSETQQAIAELPSDMVVTSCPWLTGVLPRLYWTGDVFKVDNETALGGWVGEARRVGVHSMCRVEMDMCSTTPLDRIAVERAANPGGIEAICYTD